MIKDLKMILQKYQRIINLRFPTK